MTDSDGPSIEDAMALIQTLHDATEISITRIDTTMATKSDMNRRFDLVDQRFDDVNHRFDRLEAMIVELKPKRGRSQGRD